MSEAEERVRAIRGRTGPTVVNALGKQDMDDLRWLLQERDGLKALLARLREALQEIDSKDRHGFRDEDGVWHERPLSLAQKALALIPEAALAEQEAHRE